MTEKPHFTATNITLTVLLLAVTFGFTGVSFAQTNSQISCSSLGKRNLQKNDSGTAVLTLQKILNLSSDTQVAVTGPGSPGNETNRFGYLTYLAVIKFQEKYKADILIPAGVSLGTGYVGPATRAKLLEVCNKSNAVKTTAEATTSTPEGILQTASVMIASLNQKVSKLYSDFYKYRDGRNNNNNNSRQTTTTIPTPTPSPTPAPASSPSPSPTPTPTPAPSPAPTPQPTPAPTPAPTPSPSTSKYPLHTNIVATVFWVGEPKGGGSSEDNALSAWDDAWESHYGGYDDYVNRNGYYPKGFTPKENPFYLDLPYNDFSDSGNRKSNALTVIPWANIKTWTSKESILKNRWVKLIRNGVTCYGQIEDAGPYEYDDYAYVFGTNDARPKSKTANNAGMDVSPALRDCLKFSGLNNADNKVDWQFVEAVDVPAGPWKEIVTTSQIHWP